MDNRKAYRAKWYQENKERVREVGRAYNYKQKYGITIEDYNSLLEKQNGVCAICKLPETSRQRPHEKVRYLAVDHCHKTEKVRKLLCKRCNHVLGACEDDEHLFQKFIDYLKEFKDGFQS